MTFEEIITALVAHNERVTHCFFFWEGPTLEHIEETRRKDPKRASTMKKPICNTCRPALLKVLNKLYGNRPFNYEEHVSDLYLYLMEGNKLNTIRNPNALMSWIVTTAYNYFLHAKIKKDKILESADIDSLTVVHYDIEEDDAKKTTREFVQEVIDAMPHREYAMILNEVTLEVGQFKGKERSDKMKEIAARLNIPKDNLYVKVSLAKKQFKETAKRISLR